MIASAASKSSTKSTSGIESHGVLSVEIIGVKLFDALYLYHHELRHHVVTIHEFLLSTSGSDAVLKLRVFDARK